MCGKTTVDVHWVLPSNSLSSFSIYCGFAGKILFIKGTYYSSTQEIMTQLLGLFFLYCVKQEGRGYRMYGSVSTINMIV